MAGTPLARTPSGRPMNNLELVENICAVSPALREALRTHVASFGVLIPHVFMGDVLAHVGALLNPDTPGGPAEVAAILAALEQGMKTGDRETRNVISLSFARDGELELFFRVLKPLLGPKTLAQLRDR